MTLSNPKGGAVIDGPFGVQSSIITIIDDDYSSGKIEFVTSENHFMESDGLAVVDVRRIGGSVGEVSAEFFCSGGYGKGWCGLCRRAPVANMGRWRDKRQAYTSQVD